MSSVSVPEAAICVRYYKVAQKSKPLPNDKKPLTVFNYIIACQ